MESPIMTSSAGQARQSLPPQAGVAGAAQGIRGQGPLLGTRCAGNQYGGGSYERASIEDGKMHLTQLHAGLIHSTACHGRGAAGVINADAVAVAARHVAWHSTATTEPPAGGG